MKNKLKKESDNRIAQVQATITKASRYAYIKNKTKKQSLQSKIMSLSTCNSKNITEIVCCCWLNLWNYTRRDKIENLENPQNHKVGIDFSNYPHLCNQKG